jgi:hypothetical protein
MEQGVRATFVNPKGRCVHYDGCYAPQEARQAVYVVGLIGVIDVVVELKRSDTKWREIILFHRFDEIGRCLQASKTNSTRSRRTRET